MISVIIPAYNAENYIRQNYNSLLSQLDTDFEIIYVDDGSNDATLSYLNDIQRKDNRVKVFSQVNSGAMVARMYGIESAKYEYVTFLDVDDTISENYISDFKVCLLKGYDLVVTGFTIKDGNKFVEKKNIKNGVYSAQDYLNNVLVRSSWELCGKVFRKKLFNNIALPNRRLSVAEDTYIFIQVLLYLEKDVFITKSFNYFYHCVENSISRQKKLLFIEDALYVGLKLKGNLIAKNVSIVNINCMILLLYSNSLRRGMIPSSHAYFKVVKGAFKLQSLLKLPLHKMIFVLIFFFINTVLK